MTDEFLEPDQSSILDSARAYTDSDGDGVPEDGNVIDAEVLQIENNPTLAELDQAYLAGVAAAEAGKGQNETPPAMPAELVKCWIRGWNAHHENGERSQDFFANKGYYAAGDGEVRKSCPYQAGTENAKLWDLGWVWYHLSSWP